VVFSADSKKIYLSGGDFGTVLEVDILDGKVLRTLSINGKVGNKSFDESFTTDLVLLSEKNQLLVLDQGNYRLVRLDLVTGKVISHTPTGRIPFGISSKRWNVCLSNCGRNQ
jgi:sugar lactone lactonase YvrE